VDLITSGPGAWRYCAERLCYAIAIGLIRKNSSIVRNKTAISDGDR
jgi:hypothetical protein